MARQNVNADPSIKHFEAYNDFSGGMNSETSNERLSNQETVNLENVELSNRGSLKKRAGFAKHCTTAFTGEGQGLFLFHPSGQTEPDYVIAVGGKIYLQKYNESTASEIVITNLASFQTAKPIEAVQYKSDLYIATGTKLVKYSGGLTASILAAYTPNADETTNIGTNALSDTSNLHTATMIRLHWSRLLISGTSENPAYLFFSHLDNPGYFPTPNSLKFESSKNEPITAIVQYRSMLAVFTRTTIQGLFGKAPSSSGTDDPYKRFLIHNGIGCVATRSAQVVGNSIMFLSDEGVQELRHISTVQEYMNVRRIDIPISSQIPKDKDACGIWFENQYHICFPSTKETFRYYFERGVWTKDKSDLLSLGQFLRHTGDLFIQGKTDGAIYKRNKDIVTDNGLKYKMVVSFKGYDLSASYNLKKLKRLYLLGRHFDKDVGLKLTVKADAKTVVDFTDSVAEVQGDYTVWTATESENVLFRSGAIVGQWILGNNPLGSRDISVQEVRLQGKCRRVYISIEHEQDTPVEIFGLGIQFRIKSL